MATGMKTKNAKKLRAVFDKHNLSARHFEIVEEKQYVVKMYENGKLIESRSIGGHSKRYAEDCGQNWNNGVINGH